MSTVAKPRQLNRDELLRLKWLLGGALSLVALWTVFFLDIEALSLVAIVGSVVLAVLIWPQLPGRLPPLVWKLAVPAIIVAMAVDFYLSPDTLPVLIRLAILLVLYRAVSYRRKREDLQLLVLGLFLIVVAGVLTVSLGFAFLLLAFTACALGFLFVINLIDATGTGTLRTAEAETAWTRLGWRKFAGRLWAVVDWRLLAFAAILFATVVVLSGLLFMVIPRFEVANGFFLDRYITRKTRSGFTDTVKFGDITDLAKDSGVAMRVDLTDSSGIEEELYWRLVVLDEYAPDGFKVSAGLKAELLRSQRTTQQLRGRSVGRRVDEVGGVWTFYVEAGVSRYLPLPGNYGSLRLKELVPVQYSASNRIAALRTESMTMTAFQLDAVELTPLLADLNFSQLLRRANSLPSGADAPSRYDPRLTLRGPEGPENAAVLQRVLAEITGGATLPAEEFSRRASAWLQGKHAYTLSVKIPTAAGEDSIVRWLDSNEPGFCEYFAAAFTVLARAAGHPTRVVAGFHGGALNAFENYFMVRNSDAHAWVEIYDGKTGWIRTDPTPGNTVTNATGQAVAAQHQQDSSWSARVDSLRVLWYRRIVNFDARQQVQMLDSVKSFTTDSSTALQQWLEQRTKRLKNWITQPWDARRLARVVFLFCSGGFGLGGLIWLGRRGWQRWRALRRPAGYDPVRQAAGKWLGRLRTEDRGRSPEDRLIVRDDLRRLRYGRRETWPEPKAVFRRARRVGKSAKR